MRVLAWMRGPAAGATNVTSPETLPGLAEKTRGAPVRGYLGGCAT